MRDQLRPELPSEARVDSQHVVADEAERAEAQACRQRAVPHGNLTGLRSRDRTRVAVRQLERDLGARVAGTDDENVAVLELRGIAVLARMQLHDPRIEVGRKLRNARDLMGAGRDDHVRRLEGASARRDDEAVAVLRDALDRDARLHRQIEAGRVVLEVVGQLVLRGIRPGRPWQAVARQRAEGRGREQAKRVPALPPRVAHSFVRVEDHEGPLLSGQVVAGRQPGLAASDHDGVVALRNHLAPPSPSGSSPSRLGAGAIGRIAQIRQLSGQRPRGQF